jgi:hypothetical protein
MTDERNKLPLVDIQVNRFKHFQRAIICGEGNAYVINL